MTSKRQLRQAYGLALALSVVGIICYAAFPVTPPENPVRILFKSAAGDVLFDHKVHTASAGYSLSCLDCHHHPQDDSVKSRACGECHQPAEKEPKSPGACTECHDPEDIEDTEMIKRSDAFHSQCIDCHKQAEAGPQECGLCHFMTK